MRERKGVTPGGRGYKSRRNADGSKLTAVELSKKSFAVKMSDSTKARKAGVDPEKQVVKKSWQGEKIRDVAKGPTKAKKK
jgi:hypothetical protein